MPLGCICIHLYSMNAAQQKIKGFSEIGLGANCFHNSAWGLIQQIWKAPGPSIGIFAPPTGARVFNLFLSYENRNIFDIWIFLVT